MEHALENALSPGETHGPVTDHEQWQVMGG